MPSPVQANVGKSVEIRLKVFEHIPVTSSAFMLTVFSLISPSHLQFGILPEVEICGCQMVGSHKKTNFWCSLTI